MNTQKCVNSCSYCKYAIGQIRRLVVLVRRKKILHLGTCLDGLKKGLHWISEANIETVLRSYLVSAFEHDSICSCIGQTERERE